MLEPFFFLAKMANFELNLVVRHGSIEPKNYVTLLENYSQKRFHDLYKYT